MNLEHLILPESKEVLKEWGYFRTDKGAAYRVFPNIRTFYKITCFYLKKKCIKDKNTRKAKKDKKIEKLTESLFQIKGYERSIVTKCCALSWIGS